MWLKIAERKLKKYENNNIRTTGNGKNNNVVKLSGRIPKDGIRPKQIGYFSFTKKAATEAADRAADKFGLDIEMIYLF